jgi:TolC family type I secretion outer membrane protein
MDLHDALSNAYKTNQDIKNAQQKFLIESESFVQALGSFLPDVNFQVSTQSSKVTNKSQYSNAPIANNGPNVSRTLSVSQNLFKGGQSTMALKMAQEQFNQIRAVLYDSEQKVLLESLKAYLALCSAQLKYDIANDTLVSYKQSLDTATEQMKVGEATLTDVSAARASYLKAQADKSNAYANLVSSKANFKDVIGKDPDDEINFPSAPEGIPEDFEGFNKFVAKSNFALIARNSELKQAKDTVKYSMGALLPSADLTLQNTRNYYSSPGVSQSGANNNVFSTSVSLTVPIFSRGGAAHSQVRQSKAKARIAAYTMDSTKNSVAAQSIALWEQYNASKDSVVFADEAIKAKEIALEGVRSEHSVGTKTMLEVLRQQDEFNNARSQAVDIKQNYINIAYQMKAFMGQMTAKKLKLNAQYFEPELEYRNLKHKVVGF